MSHTVCAVQDARIILLPLRRRWQVLQRSVRAGGCNAGLMSYSKVWHRRPLPSPKWCQCPGQCSKLQRLLPAQGTKPPPLAFSTSVPTLLHEPRPLKTCAQVSQARAPHGLSMQTHAKVFPRVPVSPRGGMDAKEDAFVTQKVLVKC